MSQFTLQVKGKKEVKKFPTLNVLKDHLVSQSSCVWLFNAFRLYAQKVFQTGYAEIELEETYIIKRVPDE